VLARRAREALAVDVREALASTDVPLLYLAPTRDRLVRTDVVDDVLRARPDAVTEFVDAPHTVLQVRPQECLARIEPFLASVTA
jgi:pimeloyl-ACP methyl ester carboxylesterase